MNDADANQPNNTTTFLVLPTNRPHNLAPFLHAWGDRGGWDKVVVVEDGPTRTANLPIPQGIDYHYSWAEIDRVLGARSWVISRRDSAVRCFGLLAAHHLGATHVLTLDDDCFPNGETALGPFRRHSSLAGAHRAVLEGYSVWTSSALGHRTRGLPYSNVGCLDSVVANVGLWTGSGDPDALTEETHGRQTDYTPPRGSRLVPAGQLIPVCGMNLFIARRALPLFYFPLMGEGSPYRRFDDIWAGVIAKTLMDRLGWNLAVGEPWVHHRRASDSRLNLTAEQPGMMANEHFWEVVRGCRLRGDAPPDLLRHLGRYLEAGAYGAGPTDHYYLRHLGEALSVWAGLFGESGGWAEKFMEAEQATA